MKGNNNCLLYSLPTITPKHTDAITWKIVQANPSYRICMLNEPIQIKLTTTMIKTYFNKIDILDDTLYDNLMEQVNQVVRPFGLICDWVKYQWQQKHEDMMKDTIYHCNLSLKCTYLIRREFDLKVRAKFIVTDYKILSTFK